MNVAALLQDSPSDDHRRRQEMRDRGEADRDRDRDRAFARDWHREREQREREFDRERERDRERDVYAQAQGTAAAAAAASSPPPPSSSAAPPQGTAALASHRPYSPLGSALPLPHRGRSHTGGGHAHGNGNAHDAGAGKPHRPGPAPSVNNNKSGSTTATTAASAAELDAFQARDHPRARADSNPGQGQYRPTAQQHSMSHSPPAGMYAGEYDYQGLGQGRGARKGGPSALYERERDRDREPTPRGRSTSGSATRPRSPPGAYGGGDYHHDSGRTTPSSRSAAHSPGYSVVPPPQGPPPAAHHHHHLSPPLSTVHGPGNSSSSGVSLRPPASASGSRAPPPTLPSATPKHGYEGPGPSPAMGSLRPPGPYDEGGGYSSRLPPAPSSASSSSSSMLGPATAVRERDYPRDRDRDRTLKEDIDRERERERVEAVEREQREIQRRAGGGRAGAGMHASPPAAHLERRERDVEYERLRVGEAQNQSQMPHHHHPSRHGHHYSQQSSSSHSQQSSHGPPPPDVPHRQHNAHSHQAQHAQQQQQQQQQQHPPPLPHAAPKSNRGVLKLAPPGVTVPNNPPPGSAGDGGSGAGGHSGYPRGETLTLAPASHPHHAHQPPSQGAHMQQQQQHMSSPSMSERIGGEQPYAPPPLNKKGSGYAVVPTGPGVPPPGSAGLHPPPPSQQQFGGPLPGHPHMHHPQSHHALPPPPQSGSAHAALHSQMQHPYRHIPSPLPPPHMYPPHMHYNEPPPQPVPMAFPPLPPPTPPMQEPAGPTEPPVDLGTFVYPQTPFPYFFPALPPREDQDSAKPLERPTHLTILIPSAFLSASLPRRGQPRIWGGALVRGRRTLPPSDPYAPYYALQRPQPFGASRRVYTDDSDVVLCALHAGLISWGAVRRARAAGLDLSVRLALHGGVGCFVGGAGAFADRLLPREVDRGLKQLVQGKRDRDREQEAQDEQAWVMLESATWESGHDGSGMEVIGAEWLPHGASHKRGLRNRAQRLREYTERRRVLIGDAAPGPSSTSVLGKRAARRVDLSSMPLALSADEREMNAARTVKFGKFLDRLAIGYEYDPSIVRSILFPSYPNSTLNIRRRKRRKLDDSASVNAAESDVAPLEEHDKDEAAAKANKIVLENDEERFLLVASAADDGEAEAAPSGANKENVEKQARVERRYDVYVLRPRADAAPASSPSQESRFREESTRTRKADPTAAGVKSEPKTNGKASADDGSESIPTAALPSPTSAHASPRQEKATSKRTSLAALMDNSDGAANTKDARPTHAESDVDANPAHPHPSGMPTPPLTTAESESLSELKTDDIPTASSSSSTSTSGHRARAATKDLYPLCAREPPMCAQLLYRGLGAERLQFLARGVSIVSPGAGGGSTSEQPAFVRVHRWRRAALQEVGALEG